MIARIAALSFLIATATAAKAPRRKLAASHPQRALSSDSGEEYFCDCICDGVSNAEVWVMDAIGPDTLTAMEGITDAYLATADTGEDDDGNKYTLLCLNDDNVFDLLYDYGTQAFCNDDCDEILDADSGDSGDDGSLDSESYDDDDDYHTDTPTDTPYYYEDTDAPTDTPYYYDDTDAPTPYYDDTDAPTESPTWTTDDDTVESFDDDLY